MIKCEKHRYFTKEQRRMANKLTKYVRHNQSLKKCKLKTQTGIKNSYMHGVDVKILHGSHIAARKVN